MQKKPFLYDVFSGAGGACKGYQRAGFRVIGVDNRPQPRYCGDGFIQMDAFEFLCRLQQGEFEEPDAIHASPPCQRYSRMHFLPWLAGKEYWDSIPPTREAIQAVGVPWVLENVMDSKIPGGFLCGAMFGMPFYLHRRFETSFFWLQPGHPRHSFTVRPGRMYGHSGGRLMDSKQSDGIGWMTQAERAQAIPPAYTQYIGTQLLKVLHAQA